MPIRRLFAAVAFAAVFGTSATHAAESPKGPASPAVAARPNASNGGGHSANAPADLRGVEKNGSGEHAARENRRAGRTVYVPGYGYSNWYGDYSNPYWNTPGTWYSNDGSDAAQQPPSNGDTPAPIPSARSQEDAARAEMATARARLAKEFESSDEIRSALHEVQEAQHAFDAAVSKVNQALKQDPAYEQAEAKKQQAARKVDAAQAADRQAAPGGAATQPAPISPAVVRAAEQKLDAASQVTAIASDRAQSDPAVIDAREKLEAAAGRLNGLKAKFDAALNSDSQWQAAKQKLDAAKSVISR